MSRFLYKEIIESIRQFWLDRRNSFFIKRSVQREDLLYDYVDQVINLSIVQSRLTGCYILRWSTEAQNLPKKSKISPLAKSFPKMFFHPPQSHFISSKDTSGNMQQFSFILYRLNYMEILSICSFLQRLLRQLNWVKLVWMHSLLLFFFKRKSNVYLSAKRSGYRGRPCERIC